MGVHCINTATAHYETGVVSWHTTPASGQLQGRRIVKRVVCVVCVECVECVWCVQQIVGAS